MIENPYGIRRATMADYDQLLKQALYLAEEDSVQPVSEKRVADCVYRCCNQDQGLAGVMDGRDGDLWGSVGLVLDQFPFCEDDHLSIVWLGTSPDYRNILTHKRGMPKDYVGISKKLVQFAKWAAESMDVPLFIRLLTLRALDRKLMSYSREMPQVGAMFGYGMLNDSKRSYFDQQPVVPLRAAYAAYQHDAGFPE